MNTIEYITISISAVAIILSIISFYYQFFRKSKKAIIRLTETEIGKTYDQSLNYSIINIGNQILVLKEIWFLGEQTNQVAEFYDCLNDNKNVIIKPGEIISCNVEIKNEDLDKANSIRKYIRFRIIAPNGKLAKCNHDITDFSSNSIYGLMNVKKFHE